MRVENKSMYKGFKYVITTMSLGHRCGYIEIPKSHPLFQLDYDDDKFPNIEVHGGITYADKPHWDESACGWYIGFDRGHYDDLPDIELMSDEYKKLRNLDSLIVSSDLNHATVKSLEFVEDECKNVIEQLINL